MKNYKLTLCYDGSRYNGWQRQGNTKNTLQEKVETALSSVLEQNIEAEGSGRTDAGVHASGQTVSFRTDTRLSADDILCKLRSALPADIGAVELCEAPPRFHARLSCRGKTYVYRVWNSEAPCVFERKYVYIMPSPLDIDAMRAAAYDLCGTHDYTAFCTRRSGKHSPVRTVDSIKIERAGNELRFTFTGDGFLYNMVRIMTGTLLEVGLGKRNKNSMAEILSSLDRKNAGETAPAQGLCLTDVYY